MFSIIINGYSAKTAKKELLIANVLPICSWCLEDKWFFLGEAVSEGLDWTNFR